MAPFARILAEVLVASARNGGRLFCRLTSKQQRDRVRRAQRRRHLLLRGRGKMAKDEALKVLNFERKPKSINEPWRGTMNTLRQTIQTKGKLVRPEQGAGEPKRCLRRNTPKMSALSLKNYEAAAAEDASAEKRTNPVRLYIDEMVGQRVSILVLSAYSASRRCCRSANALRAVKVML